MSWIDDNESEIWQAEADETNQRRKRMSKIDLETMKSAYDHQDSSVSEVITALRETRAALLLLTVAKEFPTNVIARKALASLDERFDFGSGDSND
jgi:hypothetical protein